MMNSGAGMRARSTNCFDSSSCVFFLLFVEILFLYPFILNHVIHLDFIIDRLNECRGKTKSEQKKTLSFFSRSKSFQ